MIIYKITNKINNKVYIGKTKRSVRRRWYEHCYNAMNNYGKYKNSLLYKAIRKYGVQNFTIEIIEENIESEEKANERERYWIKKFNSNDERYGYNWTAGGDGGVGLFGEKNPMYGKRREDLIKLNKSRKGKKLTKEHRLNIGKSRRGKKHSAETKLKMSLIRKKAWERGVYDSKEYRQKLSKAAKGNTRKRKKVLLKEKNIIFPSVTACAKYFGISQPWMSEIIKRGHYKNYSFEFV